MPLPGDVTTITVTSTYLDMQGNPQTGTVTSVAATDTSIVVSGTPTVTPTIATGTLDVIATQHPPAAAWSNNSKKITSVANGGSAQDAAAFGQIPLIDSTASDIQAAGVQAAGSKGQTADAKHVHPFTGQLSNYLMPTGATAETYPFRWTAGTPGSAANSIPYIVAIGLPSGLLVSNITFVVQVAAVTVTNGWYALLNSSLSVLAVSAAQSSGQWASTTAPGCAVTLAMGTPYTTTAAGLYYLAVSTTAATNAKFAVSGAWISTPLQLTPVVCGFMSTAQAAPPSLSSTLPGTFTGNGGIHMYAYTS